MARAGAAAGNGQDCPGALLWKGLFHLGKHIRSGMAQPMAAA